MILKHRMTTHHVNLYHVFYRGRRHLKTRLKSHVIKATNHDGVRRFSRLKLALFLSITQYADTRTTWLKKHDVTTVRACVQKKQSRFSRQRTSVARDHS